MDIKEAINLIQMLVDNYGETNKEQAWEIIRETLIGE